VDAIGAKEKQMSRRLERRHVGGNSNSLQVASVARLFGQALN